MTAAEPESEIDVLLVEDEPIVCRAAERLLGSMGLRLHWESSREEVWARLPGASYRVLLCDLMLPDGSGFDVLTEALRLRPDVQGIVITGFATTENAIRAFAEGAFDYLPKPFDMDELAGVVDRALRYRERRAELVPAPRGFRVPGPAGEPPAHFLGGNSWALLDEDGTALVGPAETFFGCVDAVEEVDLPASGDSTFQGGRLARLRSASDKIYRVWAPLSGNVIDVNHALLSNPAPIVEDPFGEGWLVRIVPSRMYRELGRLSNRDIAANAAPPSNDPT